MVDNCPLSLLARRGVLGASRKISFAHFAAKLSFYQRLCVAATTLFSSVLRTAFRSRALLHLGTNRPRIFRFAW